MTESRMTTFAAKETNFQPGTYYNDDKCIDMIDWCIANKKPFFAEVTNLAGKCTYCNQWNTKCTGTKTFQQYMSTSKIYFGVYDSANSRHSKLTKKIRQYVGELFNFGSFPYGMIYADSEFNECFQRPTDDPMTRSFVKSSSRVLTDDELIAVLKTYEERAELNVDQTFIVTFKNWDGTILSQQEVQFGKSATPPEVPSRKGYVFDGWDKPYVNICADVILTAQYKADETVSPIRRRFIETNLFGIGHDVQLHMRDNVTCYYLSKFNVILPKLEFSISFMKNSSEATGTMQSITYKVCQKWTCPECTYKYAQHKFVRFTENPDGSGKEYIPGQQYESTYGDFSIYAQYKTSRSVMVILVASNMNRTIYKSIEQVYDMIYATYGERNDVEYHCMTDKVDTIKDGTIQVERPSKENVMRLFTHGCQSGDYVLVIMYIFDHGNDGHISVRAMPGALKQEITGTEFADVISNGHPDTRIMMMIDCCHSGAVDPFLPKAANPNAQANAQTQCDMLNVDDYQQANDVSSNAVDVTDLMFSRFDENAANARVQSYVFGATAASKTTSNPEPKILCWHNCKASANGWSTSESKWMIHIKELLKNNQSYADNWKRINKNPYWYNDAGEGTFYGYSATKPKNASFGTVYAYGYKSNYHDNFDESLPVFT